MFKLYRPIAMIDLAFLTNMMDGNESLAKKFVDIFKSQAPRQMEELKLHIRAKDWEAVSNTSHSLKSQFNYLNLTSLAAQIAMVELLADENRIEGIDTLLKEIEEEFLKLF